jgi:hypothetical protein
MQAKAAMAELAEMQVTQQEARALEAAALEGR